MDEREEDWLARLQELPAEHVFVRHEPPTPRYGRAQAKLPYLIREAMFVGSRTTSRSDAWEIATWARAGSGRGYGYYSCFRLFVQSDRPTVAVLFCFYDGTERSPGFKSFDAAAQYAAANGFKVTE